MEHLKPEIQPKKEFYDVLKPQFRTMLNAKEFSPPQKFFVDTQRYGAGLEELKRLLKENAGKQIVIKYLIPANNHVHSFGLYVKHEEGFILNREDDESYQVFRNLFKLELFIVAYYKYKFESQDNLFVSFLGLNQHN
jgi:hypothetical protein